MDQLYTLSSKLDENEKYSQVSPVNFNRVVAHPRDEEFALVDGRRLFVVAKQFARVAEHQQVFKFVSVVLCIDRFVAQDPAALIRRHSYFPLT